MRASDIAVEMRTVTTDDSVSVAVEVMTQDELPGLIVVDARRRPKLVIPGTQVLRMAVLHSYQEDPALVRTIDEAHADLFWQESGDRTVGDCLPRKTAKAVSVAPDATLLEVATAMARLRCPLAAMVNPSGELIAGITLNQLLSTFTLPDHSI